MDSKIDVVTQKKELYVSNFTEEKSGEGGHFSTLALLGISYAILNTWAASSGSIYIGFAAGGPIAIVYGTIVGTIGALTIAISLAEMCHIFPTKGAQYHWVWLLMPEGFASRRFLSYISGWMGTAGWIALTSTAPLLSAQQILVNIQVFHSNFKPGVWFIFILYMGFSLYATIITIYGVKLFNKINSAAFWVSLSALLRRITKETR